MSPIAGQYPAYNYIIGFAGTNGMAAAMGGFSAVSGLLTFPIQKHGDKIIGLRKIPDITFKRGVVDSSSLWSWISQVRTAGGTNRRDAIVILRDESNNPVQGWKLHNASPVKYTGPTLAGKGGGEVAIEELVLSAEGIEIVPPR